LQFGAPDPNTIYKDRPSAFGVAARGDGRVALVRVQRPERTYFDLPGGALEDRESDEAALIREFGEETGLVVRPKRRLARSGQYLITASGQPANNLASYFAVEVVKDDPALKIEVDHTLVWLEAMAALKALRHEAHAWALAVHLRSAEV
jgi:8-oxo-dGTP diphosphatase